MPRTRSKKNHYFTIVHEQAIIDYCATEDQRLRNDLYKNFIGPVFDEMVDKIVYTYKFTTLPNIDVLRDDCKNWLITVLNKFDHTKGSKAFTYFSVVSKNWFIAQVKKTSKKARKESQIDDCYISGASESGLQRSNDDNLIVHNTYIQDRDKFEFFQTLKDEIEEWESLPLRPNERKTLQAVQILFSESENIEIFNKKAIYLYIREITGLNTKQVVNSLNKIRKRYREFKQEWDNQ
tara:strand:+ start:7636 stop:8343 length:708 start_codon:yes stop_codon:yes gene_type:complete